MNRSNPTHRLPNWSFDISIKRKLRLPLHDHNNPPICRCGKTHDIYGDHAFQCRHISKMSAHNSIRDSWAKALQPALATAGYIPPNATIQTEQENLPLTDIAARPFDISFHPNTTTTSPNYVNCPFTTIGADITITHNVISQPFELSADVQKQYTAAAEKHLQNIERKKYLRNNKTDTLTSTTIHGETTISELLQANTALLAFVIDPHGQWGPITKNFLLPTSLQSEPTFPTRKPFAQTMYLRATKSPCPTAILQTANIHWQRNKTRQFFGHSHMSPTPSIFTIQQLGLGILKSFATHLRDCKTLLTNRL